MPQKVKTLKINDKLRIKLADTAVKARKNSYSPYSKYPVGAAVLCSSGKIYSGCNIENASFGLSMCAERTAIFKAVSEGERNILAVAIAAKAATPCGACRQVILEFAGKDAEIILVDIDATTDRRKIMRATAGAMLPMAFMPEKAGL